MAGIYAQAVGTERKLAEEESKVKSEAGQKELQTQEKVYDVKKEYQDAAEKGLSDKAWWQKGLGALAMIGGTMMGLGPLMMGLLSSAGTLLGGKIGHEKMKTRIGKTEAGKGGWLQTSRSKLKDASQRETLMAGLVSGVAGAAAGKTIQGAEGVGSATVGGVSKDVNMTTNLFKPSQYYTGPMSVVKQAGWNLKQGWSAMIGQGGAGAKGMVGGIMGGGSQTLMDLLYPEEED